MPERDAAFARRVLLQLFQGGTSSADTEKKAALAVTNTIPEALNAQAEVLGPA